MKKLIKSAVLIIVFLVFGTLSIANADLVNPLCLDPGNPAVKCIDSFPEFLAEVGNFIFTLGLLIVPIIIIVAGLLFVVSRGNAQKVDQARKMLLWAVIGLAVMLSAKAMASLIKTILG